jgi:hypothetical protein
MNKQDMLRKHLGQTEEEFQDLGKKNTLDAMEEYAQQQLKNLNIPVVRRSCSICQHYQCEEVGDSDYGAIYADAATCQKYLDFDEKTEDTIENFDRNTERDCCELDFWKVADIDEEVGKLISDHNGNTDRAYKLFVERYNYA